MPVLRQLKTVVFSMIRRGLKHRKMGCRISATCLTLSPILGGSSQLVSGLDHPCKGHLEGEQPYLGDLLAMVIDHLLIGMILQVVMVQWENGPVKETIFGKTKITPSSMTMGGKVLFTQTIRSLNQFILD